jgi:hypothetical protein
MNLYVSSGFHYFTPYDFLLRSFDLTAGENMKPVICSNLRSTEFTEVFLVFRIEVLGFLATSQCRFIVA